MKDIYADGLERAHRGRGLEIVSELKTTANGGFTVREADYPGVEGVDAKLVRMALVVGAWMGTTDDNLNKWARFSYTLRTTTSPYRLLAAVSPISSMSTTH